MRRSYVHAVSLAMGAILILAGAALAGPPWIAVEFPANPHHPSTRDATFLIRAYHHSEAIDVPLVARLEGLVDGARKTVQARVSKTNLPGVFAVYADVPETGAWVAAVTLTQGENATATALVTLAGDGRVVSANVPSNRTRDGWVVPREVTAADIEAELRRATRLADAATDDVTHHAGLGAGLLLLAFAAAAGRKARNR